VKEDPFRRNYLHSLLNRTWVLAPWVSDAEKHAELTRRVLVYRDVLDFAADATTADPTSHTAMYAKTLHLYFDDFGHGLLHNMMFSLKNSKKSPDVALETIRALVALNPRLVEQRSFCKVRLTPLAFFIHNIQEFGETEAHLFAEILNIFTAAGMSAVPTMVDAIVTSCKRGVMPYLRALLFHFKTLEAKLSDRHLVRLIGTEEEQARQFADPAFIACLDHLFDQGAVNMTDFEAFACFHFCHTKSAAEYVAKRCVTCGISLTISEFFSFDTEYYEPVALEIYLKHGAAVNPPDPTSPLDVPLFRAIKAQNVEAVDLLLQYGAGDNEYFRRHNLPKPSEFAAQIESSDGIMARFEPLGVMLKKLEKKIFSQQG